MHLIVDVQVLEVPASSLLDLLLGSSVGSVIMYVDVAFSFIPVTMNEWKWRDGGGSPMWYAHVCRGRCNHALSVPMLMEACMLMA